MRDTWVPRWGYYDGTATNDEIDALRARAFTLQPNMVDGAFLDQTIAVCDEALRRTYVAEGWWHPNVNAGKVHEHPERPGRGWSEASHRLCEPVYTRRGI